MRHTGFFVIFPFLCYIISSVYSMSTLTNITAYNPLTYNQTLISNNGIFELGFFTPDNSSSNIYLGLWYVNKQSYNDALQVIWVANRNNPLNDSSGVVLSVSDNGSLTILDGKRQSIWSSLSSVSTESSNSNGSIANITDDGNFVLYQDEDIVWRSFDHPTDTLLPGMKLEVDNNVQKKELVSWRNISDPSNGIFRLGVNPHNPPEFFVWDGDNKPYWRTGPWNGAKFIGMDLRPSVLLDTFTYVNDTQGKVSFTLSPPDDESILERYVMQSDGAVVRYDWNDSDKNWTTVWKSWISECDIYGKCGEFGVCNPKNPKNLCDCMEGYEPKNEGEWNEGNWTSGCVRKKQLWCDNVNAEGKVDRFIRLKNAKVPDFAQLIASNGEDDCRNRCLEQCSCLAYTYLLGSGPYSCLNWNTNLVDVQILSYARIDLFIRTSEPDNSNKLKIILPAVLIITAILAFFILYFIWRWKRRSSWNRITKEDMPCQEVLKPDLAYPVEFRDLPLFEFDQLLEATNNFRESNKLGQGGFGPVYKGKLKDGQEIAVKRLAKASGQGIEEFMNEVLLISKLQHRNLVKLLGCCVEREEKVLVYEYLPNKSLDALLFGDIWLRNMQWMDDFQKNQMYSASEYCC